jgi:hypothetical protein
MEFSPGALTAGLAAATVHGHEATAEEGLVKELSEPGASAPLGIGQVASMPHGNHLLSYYLIYNNISDIGRIVKQIMNANLLRGDGEDLTCGIQKGFPDEKYRVTEFLPNLPTFTFE